MLDCLRFLCLCVRLGACPQTSPQRAEEEDSSWRQADEWQPALPQPDSQSSRFNIDWNQQQVKGLLVDLTAEVKGQYCSNVYSSNWVWKLRVTLTNRESSYFLQNWFVFGQIGHFHASPSQYYAQEWLLYDWIGTFPLTSGLHSLSSYTLNTDFPLRSRKAVWHHLLESVGISIKCLMACAQQDTPKPGRMWQITNVSRPTPLSCPAHRKYICLHLVCAE